jgi:hypothetical protein
MVKRIGLRLLPAGLACSLLMLAVLPVAALAAEKPIDVYPDEVAVGSKVKVRATGYNAGYPDISLRAGFPFVTVYLSSEEAAPGEVMGVDVKTYAVVDDSCKVDEFGRWETWIHVPSELTDGVYVGDVEEGAYFLYVTYWSDDVIVAASVLEVTDVPDEDFFPFWWGYHPSPWWHFPYGGCWPYYDDGSEWDGISYPCPWRLPDDCCDERPDEWDDPCPLPWPPRPYCWYVIPTPPCDH